MSDMKNRFSFERLYFFEEIGDEFFFVMKSKGEEEKEGRDCEIGSER